jgi:hypothetical protein
MVTMMTEIKIQIRAIIRGDYEKMKYTLDNEVPNDATLLLEDEPYCNIQDRNSLRVFKLIINDTRFVFDDLFIARQLYFSAGKSRAVVMKHPKFLQILRARKYFSEYFYERFGKDANRTHVGMLQRYLQAENAIRFWNKQNRWRLTFLVYPALVRYIRNFKMRFYAPSAAGYLLAKKEFESLIVA